ncbi:MAG: TIGR01777 family oxidoreductase [Planctomycetota bacterium]
MAEHTYDKSSVIDAPCRFVWDWHLRPGALARLNPPWVEVEFHKAEGVHDGARVELYPKIGPCKVKWVAEHKDYVEGRQFHDSTVQGPMSKWEHTHKFDPAQGEDETTAPMRMTDHVVYTMPMGPLGSVAHGLFAERDIRRMFDYRHRLLADDITDHWADRDKSKLTVAVSGSTGLVGQSLTDFLTTGGHCVRPIRRSGARQGAIGWDTTNHLVDREAMEGCNAVVHLAGESSMGRWTDAKKRRVHDSRVDGTRAVSEAIAKMQHKPDVLVCASAIGFYGERGDEELTEQSAAGDGFMPEVCKAWEGACQPARDAGVRVVNLRIGVVLTPAGGALKQMLPLFKLALGGRLGAGGQYWSWISHEDLVGSILHCIRNDQLAGPVNATAPDPVTNADFTDALGDVLHRPTLLPVPRFGPALIYGQEMVDALLFGSIRVLPTELNRTSFTFRHPTLRHALAELLGRQNPFDA